ncbi:MAG: hypothetical protein LWW86_16435 [Micrococcales bacterium]|nr:hypothetical protein [Micrococcales bacterium]
MSSPQPTHSRHGGRVKRLPDLRSLTSVTRAGAKTVAGLSLVAGVAGALALETAPQQASAEPAAAAPVAASSVARPGPRDTDAASRSTARVSRAAAAIAVKAPAAAAPAAKPGATAAKAAAPAAAYGLTGFTAVAKPKPKPKPKPVVEESDSTDEQSSSATDSNDSSTASSDESASQTPSSDAASQGKSGSSSDDASSSSSSGGSSSSSESSSSSGSSSSESSSQSSSGGGNTGAFMSKCAGKGLSYSAQRVCAAALANFGSGISSVGGYRAGDWGDHGTGNAADIMTSGATGDAIASYMINHAGSLNIKYVIWEQRIWMPGRGWKFMADRGSATANHYDHVHVSVN